LRGSLFFTANAPAVDLAALSEAHLHPEVFRMLSFVFGDPFVDLFATSESRQTAKFCSVLPTDSKIPGFVLLDSMKLVWSANGLYYAFPPPELLPRVVAKICQDRARQILLIAPAHQCKDILWPLVIDNPIVLENPRGESVLTNGPDPQTHFIAWFLSGEPRRTMEFVRFIKPRFTNLKLMDLLSGKAKANYQLQDIVRRAETFMASATGTGIHPLPPKPFETLTAALQARWDDVKAAAAGSSFKTYSFPTSATFRSSAETIRKTPLMLYITVNGFNVVAVLDNGSGVTLVADHPQLEAAFPVEHRRDLPPIPISGIGSSKAMKYQRETIAFRGKQGQYMTIRPTFLVMPMSQPVVIIGNHVLSAIQLVTIAQEQHPFYSVSINFPEFLILCALQGKVPSLHIRSVPEMVKGHLMLRDIPSPDSEDVCLPAAPSRDAAESQAETVTRLAAVCFYSDLLADSAFLHSYFGDAAVDEEAAHQVNKGISAKMPHQAVDRTQLTLEQADFLCKIFSLDRHKLDLGIPAFERVLQEHGRIDLTRDPLVVFMLILILRHFPKAFSYEGNELGRFTGFKFKYELKGQIPVADAPRKHSTRDKEVVTEWLQKLIKQGCYRIVDQTPFASNTHVVYKTGKKPRVVADYRIFNLATKDTPLNINYMEEVLAFTTDLNAEFFSAGDCKAGFYQCPVDESCQELLAIRTPPPHTPSLCQY
jgi:hypothetical protein